MIIAYLGRNVKDYRQNFLRYMEALELNCPECGGKTSYHDSYNRHVHIGEVVEWIAIYRVKCSKCNVTHAVIPDFIRPYKHYSACDSEMALRDMEEGIPAEKIETAASISTLKRWMAEFREKGPQAAGMLRSLLYKLYRHTVSELIFTGLNIFATLERILTEFPDIESSNLTIGEANLWVTNHLTGNFI
jgi:hypothetical protein